MANVARTKEAKSLNSVRPDLSQSKLPLSDYKKEAGNYLRSRDELINRPKLSSRYLETRRPHGIIPTTNAKDMIAGKLPTFTRIPIGKQTTFEERNSNPRGSKNEPHIGIRKGGKNDFRNV